jgi:hypothetical protein
MQANKDWTKQYYNEEAQKLIEERKSLWSPELQKQVEEQWTQLIRDIEAAAAERMDPAGPAALALAARHAKLIEGFTGGHAAIDEGLCKLWADQENWPEEMKKLVFEPFASRGIEAARGPAPSLLSPEADAFLKKALEARNRGK